jgi:predicted metal-dependent HD superfamily phosphohydrolase
MPTRRAELRNRWRALLPGAEALGERLLDRWSEPHRQYHTLDHLAAVLAVVDRYAGLASDADAVRLAGWFHDAVYDPRAGDNEERSAALAEAELADTGLPPDRIAETARLVRLTAGHQVPDDTNDDTNLDTNLDTDGALLADADLAILAAPPTDYDRYAAAIRREYAHVAEDAFRAGRAAVLGALADLPALYRIVPPRREWEARARSNLARELRTLR